MTIETKPVMRALVWNEGEEPEKLLYSCGECAFATSDPRRASDHESCHGKFYFGQRSHHRECPWRKLR